MQPIRKGLFNNQKSDNRTHPKSNTFNCILKNKIVASVQLKLYKDYIKKKYSADSCIFTPIAYIFNLEY